jgi:hypothetical protein
VSGNTTVGGTLTVSANKSTVLGGTLTVSGATTINNETNVNGKFKVDTNGYEELQIAENLGTLIKGSSGIELRIDDVFHISKSDNAGIIFYADNDESLINVNTSINGNFSLTGNATIGGTLTTTGATSLSNTLTVSGATSLSNTLTVSGATSLNSTLNVVGVATLNNALNVDGDLKVKTNKFIVASSTGNTTIVGTLGVGSTSTFTGKITASGGLTSPLDIETTGTGKITSVSSITAGSDIISTSGNLFLKKRDFSIKMGNSSGTIYDWTISKTSATTIGSLEIKNSGNPLNGTFSIDSTGLVKALKFRTNEDYVLNNINVEKFNGHTISSTSSTPSNSDMILWESASGTEIKRVVFTDLPAATYSGTGTTYPESDIKGLMTPENLARIKRLENIAFPEVGEATNLIGSVNGEETEIAGGNVQIDTTHIYLSGNTGTKLSDRLSSNANELVRLATQVPNNSTFNTVANQVIISSANAVPVWGKITDNQINTTITKISPKTPTPTNDTAYHIAFWNSDRTGLHNDEDVIYNPYSNTLTATNVTSRSSRTVKKDITTYTSSAFDTLNQIEIVSYHYKNDETQADKVGFIAEDSPELVAGINHDKMEMGNCIGLLIKAVQELKKENEELRRLLNERNS